MFTFSQLELLRKTLFAFWLYLENFRINYSKLELVQSKDYDFNGT